MCLDSGLKTNLIPRATAINTVLGIVYTVHEVYKLILISFVLINFFVNIFSDCGFLGWTIPYSEYQMKWLVFV